MTLSNAPSVFISVYSLISISIAVDRYGERVGLRLFTAFLVTDNTSTLALRHKHEPQVCRNEVDHLLNQLSDFPLRSAAQTLIAHVNQLTQITGQIQRGVASVWKQVSCVLVRNPCFSCVFTH